MHDFTEHTPLLQVRPVPQSLSDLHAQRELLHLPVVQLEPPLQASAAQKPDVPSVQTSEPPHAWLSLLQVAAPHVEGVAVQDWLEHWVRDVHAQRPETQ